MKRWSLNISRLGCVYEFAYEAKICLTKDF